MLKSTVLALVFGAVSVWAAYDPLAEFNQRLDAFIKLRAKAAGDVPAASKKATPAEIDQREMALAEAIRKARPDARQGNVFSPTVRPVFLKLLKESLTGAGSSKTRETIKEGNPQTDKAPGEVDPQVKVNAVYPKNSPLSSVPPSLLMKLPKLPNDIEYRFVGRTLLLRDRQSGVIIDYLSQAVPAQ
jgi:hypothetical protein